jgi:hypothetical protein
MSPGSHSISSSMTIKSSRKRIRRTKRKCKWLMRSSSEFSTSDLSCKLCNHRMRASNPRSLIPTSFNSRDLKDLGNPILLLSSDPWVVSSGVAACSASERCWASSLSAICPEIFPSSPFISHSNRARQPSSWRETWLRAPVSRFGSARSFEMKGSGSCDEYDLISVSILSFTLRRVHFKRPLPLFIDCLMK